MSDAGNWSVETRVQEVGGHIAEPVDDGVEPTQEEVIVECPRDRCQDGRLKSCWPIEQDALYSCTACVQPGVCHTAHCDACGSYRICSRCMQQAGVYQRMWHNLPGCDGPFVRRFQIYTAKKPMPKQ